MIKSPQKHRRYLRHLETTKFSHDTSDTSVMVVPCSKVLALPLFAVSWALFKVWRVAFRQAGCLRIQIKKT